MVPRLLILDNAIDHATHQPVAEWVRHMDGVRFDVVHMPQSEPVPQLERYTHVLLTGSSASLLNPPPWCTREAKVVREAASRGRVILGSCFGHQMLAWALSGAECVRRALTPELGWIAVALLEPDPLFGQVPSPWHTFAGHVDEVANVPPPWRTLARNTACAVQAMRYGTLPIWGLQPHPETSPAEGLRQMQAALLRFPEHAEAIRAALAAPVRDDKAATAVSAAFLAASPMP
jgi:GMP synthase-like glutamine amidotransferase